MLGQEKDFCLGSNSLYLARGFQSIHSGHRNIQDDNVRLKLPGMNHRVGTICRIANNCKVRFGPKQCADSCSCDRMVVNDDDVYALTHRSTLPPVVTARKYPLHGRAGKALPITKVHCATVFPSPAS